MFKCYMCGECCRHLDASELYKDLDRGDGVCRYLEGNHCSIYNDRPILCRVDDSYEKYFFNYYSREEYYRMNEEACKQLQKLRR